MTVCLRMDADLGFQVSLPSSPFFFPSRGQNATARDGHVVGVVGDVWPGKG